MNTTPLLIYLGIGACSVLFELIAQKRFRDAGIAVGFPPPWFWLAQLLGWPIELLGLMLHWGGDSRLLAGYYDAIHAPKISWTRCAACGGELCEDCGECHVCETPDDFDELPLC